MKKFRTVALFGSYLEDFLDTLPAKIHDKVLQSIAALEYLDMIPSSILKHITGTKGLYELRVELGTDAVRVFCFFDMGRIIVLINGFRKKTQKTPRKEIDRALKLMKEYYESKK